MPTITRITLLACAGAALLGLGWLAVPPYSGFHNALPEAGDWPFLAFVVAPYGIVALLAWLQRGRQPLARVLFVSVLLMVCLGMIAAAADLWLRNEVIILSFLYPLVTWFITGLLGLAWLWQRRRPLDATSQESSA